MSSRTAAVIGLGGMGVRHLQALRVAGVEAVAVCDRREESFAVACAHSPKAKRYSDGLELIRDLCKRLDLLVIATNGPSHHALTLSAAAAGIRHVLCEKPMSTSGLKARDMAAQCKARGTRLAVNHARRFSERFHRLRRFLNGGSIGELLHVNVSVGAGGLGCIGTHYFDLVSWISGEAPSAVTGTIDASVAPNVRGADFHDPGGTGFVRYGSKLTASYQLSGEAPVMPLLQFVCSEGYLELVGWAGDGGLVRIYARPESERGVLKTRYVKPKEIAFDAGPPMDLVDASRRCIEDLLGNHIEDTAAGGIAAVDTVIGFHLSSARGGALIPLPLSGDDLALEVAMT